MEDAYLVAIGKADTMADSEKGPLEGLGKFRGTLKTLIDVGKKVAAVRFVVLLYLVTERRENCRCSIDISSCSSGCRAMCSCVGGTSAIY